MKTTVAKFFVMLVCVFVFSAVSFGATRTTFLPFQVPSVFDRVCIKKHAKKQAASQGELPKNKLPQNPKAGER
ncbi:MAG: hypothetical protein LBH00_11530, partial [Planctomycetaceae bacterium]|nr:hypothetical protein [Planctomycetaceae bacterium]